jgi:hypothetical protein
MARGSGTGDVRLIDPTEAQLVAALRKAHAVANRGLRDYYPRLERDGDFWGRFARDCLREREGRRRSCKAGSQTPEVIAGWWTDPAGRRHFRVIGRTRVTYGRLRGEGELRGLPPWWQVYPESILAVRRPDGPETFLACCRCGAVGTPESLGWMGDTCGPCFDRRADGGALAGGFGHFSGWYGYQARFAFSADCSRLVGAQNHTNKLRVVSRADGAEVIGKSVGGALAAVADVPGGFLFGYLDGTVYRWAGDHSPAACVVKRPRFYGRLTLSTDGRRAVVLSSEVAFTADLTAAAPRYARVDGTRTYLWARFAPTGNRLLGVAPNGELAAIHPETLAAAVLRENIFAGLPRYGHLHDLAVAPDGSAVAVVREPASASPHGVRVVPVDPTRPPRDLALPAWHRPTAAAFSADGEYLATAGGENGWVGFWRLPAGTPVGFARAVPEEPNWRGGQVLFAPDGRSVAVLMVGFHQDRGSTVVVWPWPDVARAAGG